VKELSEYGHFNKNASALTETTNDIIGGSAEVGEMNKNVQYNDQLLDDSHTALNDTSLEKDLNRNADNIMIMSIVGIKYVSFEVGIKENPVQNNDKQLDGLHTPLNDISLHNDPNNNASNPQLRNAVNSQSIPVRITSRNQQRANRKKPLQKHKKMLADPTTTANGLIERYPFLITTSYVVVIETIILTNRFFV
jgi:hypothetical protein